MHRKRGVVALEFEAKPQRTLAIAKEVSVYFISVAVTAAANILTIPLLVTTGGANFWANLSLAQAAGAMVGSFTLMGWGVNGPAMLAKVNGANKVGILNKSILNRMPVYGVGLALAICFVFSNEKSNVLEFILFALTASLGGFSLAWAFIGQNSAKGLLYHDTLPRALGQVCGALIFAASKNLMAMAAVSLSGYLLSVFFSWMKLRSLFGNELTQKASNLGHPSQNMFNGVQRKNESVHGTIASWVSIFYLSAPVLFVAQFWPAQLAEYALFERIWKTASAALRPFSQALQGWVPRATNLPNMRFRIRFAAGSSMLLAFATSWFLYFFYRIISKILSSGHIDVPNALCEAGALILGCTLISQTSGMACLTALGRTAVVGQSAIAGLFTGVVVFFSLAVVRDSDRMASAVATSELTVALVQVGALWWFSRTGNIYRDARK